MSYLSPTALYFGWVLRLIYFSVYALLVIIWQIQACGTKQSLSTLTAIYGYLIVLFMSAVSGTLFQLLPNSEDKWAFHTLEKVDFRLVNLILYYFILQLLPLLIILNPEKKEIARIIKNRNRIRKYSNIFMIIAVFVSIALIAQSSYDYIYGQPSNPNDPLIQSITSLRFEVIVSLIKFLMDIALAIIFIKIFMFYFKLKLISKGASNQSRLSPYNYCIIAITLITFIYESYYSVCYIVHRFFKLYQLENAPWYAPFRDVNAQIVDILRNFWTGMVILYMFDYIRRSQVEKEKTLLEVINTMKNEEDDESERPKFESSHITLMNGSNHHDESSQEPNYYEEAQRERLIAEETKPSQFVKFFIDQAVLDYSSSSRKLSRKRSQKNRILLTESTHEIFQTKLNKTNPILIDDTM